MTTNRRPKGVSQTPQVIHSTLAETIRFLEGNQVSNSRLRILRAEELPDQGRDRVSQEERVYRPLALLREERHSS